MRRDSIEYFFATNLRLLSFFGLRCSFQERKKFRFIDKVQINFTNLLGFVLAGLEVHLIRSSLKTNSLVIFQTLSQLLANLQSCSKGFFLSYYINKIQRVFESLSDLWTGYPPSVDHQPLILGTAQKALNFAKFYIAIIFGTVIAYELQPVIDLGMQFLNRGATNHTYDFSKRVFLAKYPFEVNNILIYLLVYSQEAYLLLASGIYWSSNDSLFAQFTTHVCLQFQILKVDLETFNKTVIGERLSLVRLVERHRELLRICRAIEEIYSPMIFATMLLAGLNICVCVIGLRETIAQGHYVETSVYLFLFLAFFSQIVVYCTYAETLTEETRSLADSVYNLQWTTNDHKLRFYIQMMIMRAQKPFYCTAYGFFRIGHRQLTSIINTSFSYYMMLGAVQ